MPDRTKEELYEDIARNIQQLSLGVSKLLKGTLNRKAILVLLSYSTKMGQRDVDCVLKAIENLERDFTRKKK